MRRVAKHRNLVINLISNDDLLLFCFCGWGEGILNRIHYEWEAGINENLVYPSDYSCFNDFTYRPPATSNLTTILARWNAQGRLGLLAGVRCSIAFSLAY